MRFNIILICFLIPTINQYINFFFTLTYCYKKAVTIKCLKCVNFYIACNSNNNMPFFTIRAPMLYFKRLILPLKIFKFIITIYLDSINISIYFCATKIRFLCCSFSFFIIFIFTSMSTLFDAVL